MNTARRSLIQHAVDWALGIAVCMVVLFLNAYLEHKHSETETAAITAQIDNDNAAEHAAMKGPR
jgi:hypothetical protein